MSESRGKIIRLIVTMALFAGAFWILNNRLHEFHYRDVVRDLKAIPRLSLYLAFGLTVLNYIVLMAYDFLAFRYISDPLPYRRIAVASFIAYAFSQNLGFPMLTGGTVRYRLYSSWGLSNSSVAKIVAFTSVTFWLGILMLGGSSLLMQPRLVFTTVHYPTLLVRLGGLALLALPGFYIWWAATQGKALGSVRWNFAPPTFRLAVLQVIVSSLDWVLAAGVLYVLLPVGSSVPFLQFAAVFLFGQIIGAASHVPGGLGIFDSIVLLLLSAQLPASALFGCLVVYRAIYYVCPLLVSIVLFGAHEFLQRREHARKIADFFAQWARPIAPTLFAFATFVAGLVLIVSGATPTIHHRLFWLEQFLPLSLVELSHFLGSICGVGLLILARGLQRRLDGAYLMTAFFLTVAIIASLGKGFDYEEAMLMALLLAALLPCRSYFYRQTRFTNERFTEGWFIAILLALCSGVWLTFFSYKHIPYSTELWWKFTFSGDAPRSLRAAAGAVGVAFLYAFYQLLRPSVPNQRRPGDRELERIREIVLLSPATSANLALLGDKQFLFSESGDSFLMYQVERRSWVSLGDPVGREDEKRDLVWKFRELADKHDGWSVFYQIHKEYLDLYLDLGLTLLKLGEEARVFLPEFSMEGNSRKTFRHLLNKLDRDGFKLEIVPEDQIPILLPELQRISDEWLQSKNTKEKRFSLGFFDANYLKRFPVGVVRCNNQICAFVNLWATGGKEELSVDLMRYLADAPPGIMDFLFLRLMLWGREQGYQWFNLGMAPLSGLEDRALAPRWNRLGAFLFTHGEHFYNFKGLRQYKTKFDPVWTPRYLACPGGLVLPRVVANLTSLISGGLKGVVAK